MLSFPRSLRLAPGTRVGFPFFRLVSLFSLHLCLFLSATVVLLPVATRFGSPPLSVLPASINDPEDPIPPAPNPPSFFCVVSNTVVDTFLRLAPRPTRLRFVRNPLPLSLLFNGIYNQATSELFFFFFNSPRRFKYFLGR